MTRIPPHARALARLNRAKVDYVLIGVTAINHYAREPGEVFSTLDCDVLLRPEPRNLTRALKALAAEGYRFECGGEPVPRPDALTVQSIVANRATLRALKKGSLPLDLVLETKGYRFTDWRRRRRIFRVGRALIPCASLEQLLEAKERVGRAKDRAFLRLFRAHRKVGRVKKYKPA